MYAEMPAEEKEAWNARAEADKARYLHELATYVPPPGYDVKGDALSGHLIQPQGRARKTVGMGHAAVKTVRDPSAPRRNMSAYLLYQNCMRETFKQQNPGMTFGKCILTVAEKNSHHSHLTLLALSHNRPVSQVHLSHVQVLVCGREGTLGSPRCSGQGSFRG